MKPEYARLTAEQLAQGKGSDIDFRDSDDVVLRYYPQVIRFIKSVTGAKEVFSFDHNLRFADEVRNSTCDRQYWAAGIYYLPLVA